jgi:hypothetical protein
MVRISYTDAPGIEGKVIRFDGGEKPLHWMIFDPVGGMELARGTDWSCSPSEAEAQEWQEAASRLAAKWKGRLADLDKTLYIRYGRLPPGGKSRNYASGMWEEGIAVYPARYDLVAGAIVFDEGYGVWQGGTLIGVMSRVPYLVEGELVGTGSDGEPLLRGVRRVAILRYDLEMGGFFIKRRFPHPARPAKR